MLRLVFENNTATRLLDYRLLKVWEGLLGLVLGVIMDGFQTDSIEHILGYALLVL